MGGLVHMGGARRAPQAPRRFGLGENPGPTRLSGVLVIVLLLAACGYSVRGHLPADVRTVAVPIFANRTTKPFVETEMTRALADAFATDGRLKLAAREQADSVLEGEVTGYELVSVAFDPAANVRLYRLVVTMNVRFRDVRRNTMLFEQQGLSEKADFRVSGAVSETISREEIGLLAATRDIARAVVALAIERF
jgi:Lipopolysaccharide-assembly